MDSSTRGGFSEPTAERMRMRHAATNAAIAAGLLTFFGYGYGLIYPSSPRALRLAWLAVDYAMCVGGPASAAIAIWLWIGHRPALIVDAVVAVILGAIFVLSGMVMVVEGGDVLQAAVIVICGASFISSGMRNGQDFTRIAAKGVASGMEARNCGTSLDSADEQRLLDGDASLAKRLINRSTTTEPLDSHSNRPPETIASAAPTRQQEIGPLSTQTPSEPPPEGFLASFAKKKPLP